MLDIILLAYNNLDITFRALASIALFKPRGSRIILVDNGSTDAVPTLAEAVKSTGGIYVRVEPNAGPYRGVNAGLRASTAEYLAIVCNDIVVLPGALDEMLLIAQGGRFPYVGATGLLGPEFNFADVQFRRAMLDGGSPRGVIPGVCFSCCVFSRSVLDSVGSFDERFGITFGDTDWEQRLQDSGVTPVLATHAYVYHGHGVTRKRGGLEADLIKDTADHCAFLEKWGDRADVCAKHPLEAPDSKRAAQERSHAQGER